MTSVPPQSPQQQPSPAAGPAKPDYTMAWLPHLLMLLTWWLGPLIFWLVKKDQDKIAAYHGKQAFFWGLGMTVVAIGGCVILGILIIIPFLKLVTVVLWPCFWLVLWGGGVLAYGIYATVQTSQGKPFKYFFVADKFCAKEFAAAYPNLPQA